MRIPDIAPTEKAMPTAALSHVYRQYACQNNTFTSCSESAGRELTSVIESTEAARIRAGWRRFLSDHEAQRWGAQVSQSGQQRGVAFANLGTKPQCEPRCDSRNDVFAGCLRAWLLFRRLFVREAAVVFASDAPPKQGEDAAAHLCRASRMFGQRTAARTGQKR